jgi:hypothetical protein
MSRNVASEFGFCLGGVLLRGGIVMLLKFCWISREVMLDTGWGEGAASGLVLEITDSSACACAAVVWLLGMRFVMV